MELEEFETDKGEFTLEEYSELSSRVDEAMELDGIHDLDPGSRNYIRLEERLRRIYEADLEDLSEDEQMILLQGLMRIGGKIGPR
jgi:hypothetical protein